MYTWKKLLPPLYEKSGAHVCCRSSRLPLKTTEILLTPFSKKWLLPSRHFWRMYHEPCTLGENYLPPLQSSSCAHVCWLFSLCHLWSYARHNKDDIQYALRERRQLQCVQRPSSLYAHYYDLLHLWFCQWRHYFHPWETDAMFFFTKHLSILICAVICEKNCQ